MKLVLCIVDGFGLSNKPKNPIKTMDFWNKLWENSPQIHLHASGEHVGLPKGQQGNSDVGHSTICAGKVIEQDLVRINKKIKNLSLNTLGKKAFHIIGICSSGGIHGHIDHIIEVIKYLKKKNIKIWLHLFSDGRDVARYSFKSEVKKLYSYLDERTKIATISGRFYAMDRDQHFDRTKKAYNTIIKGKGLKFESIETFLKDQYDKKLTDEFFEPSIIGEYTGIDQDDIYIITNYRADRIIQILEYFEKYALFAYGYTLSDLPKNIKNIKILFKRPPFPQTLGSKVSNAGLKQVRIAETEKYAHVTYFFNGGTMERLPGEDRILIPSPRVKTYNQAPEMSANFITKEAEQSMQKGYDFIVMNYANADMVGHTGDYNAVLLALKSVDQNLKKLVEAVYQNNYALIITSDHGNVESMILDDNSPNKSHTTNPVPLCLVNYPYVFNNLNSLADIAHICLKIMNI